MVTVTDYEYITKTVTSVSTTTESYIREQTVTLPPVTRTVTPPVQTVVISSTIIRTTTLTRTQTQTQTVRQTIRETQTVVSTSTVRGQCGGGAACPTITQTATACRSCLVPQCTTTSVLTRPCGCNALPTQVVSFPCNDPDSCNRIGCTTVYAIQTQGGC